MRRHEERSRSKCCGTKCADRIKFCNRVKRSFDKGGGGDNVGVGDGGGEGGWDGDDGGEYANTAIELEPMMDDGAE